ncbi:MAG: crossover junction endodeoxyribonuclease RuvC [Bacteroidota bacterium]|nr:crossover junction endodeoxyribonuclease RuvC [Candidatus Kapabacteria bacterium]MCS7301942.1 crossover junction endodeoxyribonuclease RuvC [Candidatus Kapabacteria bacterium]MDW8074795.1 crossover junction endodeoxyribonuclease RuvC [Bacteroidota bacterium]
MRIIGIDPGSLICGYGVIDVNGNSLRLVEYGVVEAQRVAPELPERLDHIYRRLTAVVERTKPNAAALEALFYARNVQSLLKLSHARGVAMLVLAQHHLPITEYAARLIKRSITGKGNATKEQVSYMVKSLLCIEETPEFFDATDALAVALTHALRTDMPVAQRKRSPATTWRQFIEENPHRVRRA